MIRGNDEPGAVRVEPAQNVALHPIIENHHVEARLGELAGPLRERPGRLAGLIALLGGHHLPGRGLHQRRAAEKDGALLAHDDGFIRHRRHVSAPGGAASHHRRDLRHPRRRHARLIVEDAPEMVPVGKDLGLMGQVRPA